MTSLLFDFCVTGMVGKFGILGIRKFGDIKKMAAFWGGNSMILACERDTFVRHVGNE